MLLIFMRITLVLCSFAVTPRGEQTGGQINKWSRGVGKDFEFSFNNQGFLIKCSLDCLWTWSEGSSVSRCVELSYPLTSLIFTFFFLLSPFKKYKKSIVILQEMPFQLFTEINLFCTHHTQAIALGFLSFLLKYCSSFFTISFCESIRP